MVCSLLLAAQIPLEHVAALTASWLQAGTKTESSKCKQLDAAKVRLLMRAHEFAEQIVHSACKMRHSVH